MKTLHILISATLCLSACTSTRSVYQLNGEWNVSTLNGQAIPAADNAPFLGFDTNDSRVYGFTGCNRLTGTLDAKAFMKGKADFGQLGMTRMLCQDDKYERPFTEALGKVSTSEIEGNRMTLKDKDGNPLLILTKK